MLRKKSIFSIPGRFVASAKQYTIPKPKLSNAYDEDPILFDSIKRLIPTSAFSAINEDLRRFGSRCVNDILALGEQCELQKPKLELFDCWGNQTNRLIMTPAWKEMKSLSATEGLIAIPYERKYAEFSRLYQLAKLYMYMPSSGLYGCPLAMTDGAAHVLEKYKDLDNKPFVAEAFKRLTSREPAKFWTSGQWMTEIRGGSDVANATETVAIPFHDGLYMLYGYKFFTSAADSDMVITLARIAKNHKGEGQLSGNKGLAMFILQTHDMDGKLDRLRMLRLKDKLGTRQLPTAEMILDGCLAEQLSDVGRGISEVSNMLVITRFWTSLSSASSVRRMASLARDYATRREAFGVTLDNHSLHVQVLGQLEMEARAGLLMLLRMAQLLGLLENNKASESDLELLRVIMPLAKGYICKRAMPVLSEGLELFGGQGYMEDSGIPVIFRDAQVQPIWEGTTNIQAIDLIRAILKTKGSAIKVLLNDAKRATSKSAVGHLISDFELLTESAISPMTHKMLASSETAARDYLFSFGGFYSSALLFEHAAHTGNSADFALAERYYEIGRAEWSALPRRMKEGYYSAKSLDNIKEAVFRNHVKIDHSKAAESRQN